ncbi:MAG TPA: DUF2752 domain-containing protein [Chitinophagaceae bacterium]|nr:DUF2752 domain-containing protein [Chitinophagaceae bacterium]
MHEHKFLKISIFIIAAGCILLLYYFVEPKNGNLPTCFFHEITGLYCPGCGVQRSFHALLRGYVSTAMSYNLLFVLYLPLIIYFVLGFVLGKKYSSSSFIYQPKFSFAVLIIVISFWVLRNFPFAPFSWLAP